MERAAPLSSHRHNIQYRSTRRASGLSACTSKGSRVRGARRVFATCFGYSHADVACFSPVDGGIVIVSHFRGCVAVAWSSVRFVFVCNKPLANADVEFPQNMRQMTSRHRADSRRRTVVTVRGRFDVSPSISLGFLFLCIWSGNNAFLVMLCNVMSCHLISDGTSA